MKVSTFRLLLYILLFLLPIQVIAEDRLFKADENQPVYIEADKIEGYYQQEIEATGSVRLRRGDQVLSADRIKYYQNTEDTEVEGNVLLDRPDDILQGTYLQMNLQTGIGELNDPYYFIKDGSGRGSGDLLFLEGEDQYRLKQGHYTTCPVGNDDWYILADDLEIDNEKEVGTARHVSVRFKDVPILYLPWINFSFSGQRKTGLLAPIVGNTARSGVEVSVPFYWNIAPNYDATIAPRLMSRRGLMLNNEFRYMGQTLGGQLLLDLLPDDLVTDTTRYALQLNHAQWLGSGWFGMVHYNRVSDDDYFRDLSNNIAFTSRTNLLQQATATYQGGLGRDGVIIFNAMLQQFQTIQDPRARIISPFKRLPQFSLNAIKRDIYGLDLDFAGSWTHFSHPTLPHGLRMALFPSISLPLNTSYGYIRPRIGLHHTRYNLNTPAHHLTEDKHPTRTLPIFSLDSGVVFERDTTLWNENFIQTIEPRLFYAYIPFRDQDRLPNFDSAEMDFSFAQIFMERRFSGEDRINDANEVTLAMTSRLIHSATGNERLRFSVGQKIRFQDRRQVPDTPQITSTGSDFIAELFGSITPHITTDTSVQLNQNNFLTEKIRAGISYHPAPGKVLNAGYRFTRGVFEQVDVSTQWPFMKNWQGFASINYSLRDDRLLAGLLGLEYNACCWSLRLVANRFTTATQRTSTNIFVQLELNNLMKIGTNPIRVLQEGIPGYTRTDWQ
jgi:LPS-assembly protein